MTTFGNRAQESCTDTGTGSLGLDGALAKHYSWQEALEEENGVSSPNVFTSVGYIIVHSDPDIDEWEMGRCTFTPGSPDTISARTPISGSAGSATLVDFSAGTKVCSIVPLADDFGGGSGAPTVIRLSNAANEAVASGATEQLVTFTADDDAAGLWNTTDDEFVVPSGVTVLHFSANFIKDDGSGTTNGIMPLLDIDGTKYPDLGTIWPTTTNPQVGLFNTISFTINVSGGETVQLWGDNPDSDNGLDVTDGSIASFTMW